MITYIAARISQSLPVLLLASVAVFLVVRLVPGDAAELAAGENAPPSRVAEIRADLGLDQPLPVQYGRWLSRVARGDLGTSFDKGLPVQRLIRLALPPSVELTLLAFPLALMIGVPVGALAGLRPRSPVDWLASGWAVLALGVPGFVVATLALWLFAVQLDWLPASGRIALFTDPLGGLRTGILPAVSLALAPAAVLARFTRTSVSQVQRLDYVRTARAKGLAEQRVLWRHMLPNALVPLITVSTLQLGQMLTGAVVIEQVFTRPGMGRLMLAAVQNRDYPVVQGGLLVLVIIFVAVNLAADVAYGLVDPRMRRS